MSTGLRVLVCWKTAAAALAIGLAAAGAAFAEGPAARGGSELHPGVLVDAEGGAVYAMAVKGGVDAFDVDAARPLWHSAVGARPLALEGHRLLAQSESPVPGRFALAVLDAAAQGRLLREMNAGLPEGAAAPIDLKPGVSFRTAAQRSGDAVDVRWTYVRRPFRGTAPGTDVEEEPAERRFDGLLHVDLASGSVQSRVARRDDEGPRPLPGRVAAEADAGALRERPVRAGNLFIASQEIVRDGTRRIVLRRWTADGSPLPEVALPDGVTLQLASADDRHVLVSRRVRSAPLERSHVWTILSLATGERAAEFPAHLAAARFVVAGARVVYVSQPRGRRAEGRWVEEPLQVRAVDVASGQTVWTRAVRDTAYRGPWVP